MFFINPPRLTARVIFILISLFALSTADEKSQEVTEESASTDYEYDKKGYIIFCLCMGRIGNQMEHFLGGLAFAKSLDRTLILPPFRTYTNIPFEEWFRPDAVAQYHRVITAEEFMKHLAPIYWPAGQRIAFCWQHPHSDEKTCKMEGNPFGPFWESLGVNFDKYEVHNLSYDKWSIEHWKQEYPPDKFPVIAMKGAPAPYPMDPRNRPLQKYIVFSDTISHQGQDYIDANFRGKRFVGIHLRNGMDWTNACNHAAGQKNYMASPQCQDEGVKVVTKDMCFPSDEEIMRLVKKVMIETMAEVLFIATDKNPLIKAFETLFQQTREIQAQNVSIFHMDPQLPMVDQYILSRSYHFIGNCVSSFTSFVSRDRLIHNKPTSFFGLN